MKTTPSGESYVGYLQAVDNYVYFVETLVIHLENEPGGVFANIMDVKSRGPLFNKYGTMISEMDKIISAISETYGYDEGQVEKDIDTRMRLAAENKLG